MNPSHPALSLLIGLCLILSIGIPVLAWLLMIGRRDRPATLWFTGLLCSALGLVVIAVVQKSTGVTAVMMSIAIALVTTAIRMDLPGDHARWRLTAGWLMVYAILQAWLDAAGLRMSWGVALTSLVLSVQEAAALGWTYRAIRHHKSRGLLLVALGLLLVVVANLIRLASSLHLQEAEPIFSFTGASNLIVLSVTLTTVLFSFGYVLFMLEKAHRLNLEQVQASARAEERRQAAQQHADQLEHIIEQRDAMILMNSRFSAVNSLAIFNSAIVHEISQPLQSLRMLLEMISLTPDGDSAALREKTGQAHEVVLGMARTLQSLRDLVQMQAPQLERVQIDAALAEIEPILQTQARHRGVALHCRTQDGVREAPVLAQKVMLQRIVFNLITNALEALPVRDAQTPAAIGLSACLRQHSGCNLVVVQVQDNGPGLPQQVIERGDQPFFTTKPQGMGLGLALARVITQSWRGDLQLRNRPQDEGGGACVEICLPVQPNP